MYFVEGSVLIAWTDETDSQAAHHSGMKHLHLTLVEENSMLL